MSSTQRDTIFAPSSGQGRAGVAVVRISGPRAGAVFEAFGCVRPVPRKLTLCVLRHPATRENLDHGLVAWFPGPWSFTGEDMAEFHLHGGLAVVDGVLSALTSIDGFQPAEPGAFTRRAFDEGKLDLLEVEGLADLIDAETEAQRRQALRQMGGQLSTIYNSWRDRLVGCLAMAEAVLDFADEEDVPDDVGEHLRLELEAIGKEMRSHIDDNQRGERLREGIRVVIAGRPNVGKSSLLNYLARRDAAIVSERAGTTRDVIEVHMNLAGCPVTLVDTAGIHEADDEIEREGIDRSKLQMQRADLIVLLADPEQTEEFSDFNVETDSSPVRVLNKVDLDPNWDQKGETDSRLGISLKTGEGLEALLDQLTDLAKELIGSGHDLVLTRTRHRAALAESIEHIARVLAKPSGQDEFSAEDIRLAVRALGRITGRVDVENILDVVFSSFCIGK